MAAVLSSELHDTDKIVTLVEECRRMKLPIVNPDINSGEYRFTVNLSNEIVYGLGAIKGLGEGPVESLMQARMQGGDFKNLFDFCARVDLRKVNKRALEALIRAGAFDSLGESRAVLMQSLTEAVHAAEQQSANSSAGMDDLFGVVDANVDADVYKNFRNVQDWSLRDRLQAEKETLGLYLTGHPIDEFENDLANMHCKRLNQLVVDKKTQLVAGLIINIRFVKTKSGSKLAIVQLDDRTARIEVTIFGKLLPDVESKLIKDTIVFIRGEVEMDEFSGGQRMRGLSVNTLEEMRSQSDMRLHLTVHAQRFNEAQQACLSGLVAESEEGSKLLIHYCSDTVRADLRLGAEWRILPKDENIQQLKKVFGEQNVAFK
jgi:DNA polymerase-3 subunit alpha